MHDYISQNWPNCYTQSFYLQDQVCAGQMPVCTWFLKLGGVDMCVSPPNLLITSSVIWTQYDWLNKFYNFRRQL